MVRIVLQQQIVTFRCRNIQKGSFFVKCKAAGACRIPLHRAGHDRKLGKSAIKQGFSLVLQVRDHLFFCMAIHEQNAEIQFIGL